MRLNLGPGFVVLLCACGHDPGVAGDARARPDASAVDAARLAPADALPDASPVDSGPPCPTDACVPPPGACDGTTAARFVPTGCHVELGTPRCRYMRQEMACSEACGGGGCLPAGEPGRYVPQGALFYLTELHIAADCCRDFDGDGQPDSRLGALLQGLGEQLGQPRLYLEALQQSIGTGTYVVLLHVDASGPGEPLVEMFYGDLPDGGPRPDRPLRARIYPISFWPGTTRPIARARHAALEGDRLTADFERIYLAWPLGDVLLAPPVFDVHVEARLVPSANGAGLDVADGTISGHVRLDALYDTLNRSVAARCGCLGLGAASLVTVGPEGTGATCDPLPEPRCDPADPDIGADCGRLGLWCGTVTRALTADLDADVTGVAESLSVGLRFAGVHADFDSVGGGPDGPL